MDEQQIQRLRYLFSRYANSLSTKAEYDDFLQLINEAENDQEIKHLIDQLWAELEERQPQTITHRRPFIYRLLPYGIAAAALAGLTIGYFLFQSRATRSNTDTEQIAAIHNGVSLKLANGRTIQLSKNFKGKVNGTTASQQDSLLAYTNNTTLAEEKNTLTNNGTEKFSVNLADGTVVTLDIGSSLTYPTAFKNIREVTLSGQGYFKVKHQSQRFLVHYNQETTEDIGTEFNINAYADESATTTLIEGRIKVNNRIIKPGEQIENDHVTKADLEANLAWLQDKYIFNNQPLEQVMIWVSRNYGVKVIYRDDKLRHIAYGGVFNRKRKLASVLNFLRQTGGVDFKVENQTITVFKSKS